jgi:hypothetical protein
MCGLRAARLAQRYRRPFSLHLAAAAESARSITVHWMGPHLFVLFYLSPHSYAQAGVCAAPPARWRRLPRTYVQRYPRVPYSTARWRRLLGTYVAISSAIVNVAAMLAVREPERVCVRACVRTGRQARTDYVEPLQITAGRY